MLTQSRTHESRHVQRNAKRGADCALSLHNGPGHRVTKLRKNTCFESDRSGSRLWSLDCTEQDMQTILYPFGWSGKVCLPGSLLWRWLVLALMAAAWDDAAQSQSTVLIGTQTIIANRDFNAAGVAEAFQATGVAGGTLNQLSVYVDSGSSATNVFAGIYSDAAGAPGNLLSSGAIASPVPGSWNTINVPAATITPGGKYWISILGTGGTFRFRDQSSGTCLSQVNRTTGLTALPATWTTGSSFHDCPVSAYGSGSSVPLAPILAVSTNALNFAIVQGSANPSPAAVNVTNNGGGTLTFTTSSDSSWLTVSQNSTTAPATLQIGASGTGLAVGVYTGHVAVSATGVQGSPQVITVTFTISQAQPVTQPGDWLTIDHDPARTGFASDETTLSVSNVGNLVQSWAAPLDGRITAQPLFAGGINIGGTMHDIVIAATSNNSVYALDAGTGAVLWRRNLGAQPTNCVFPAGFGVTGAPTIDRGNLRVYAVSSGGTFFSLSLIDGSIVGSLPNLIPNPRTNVVWGGLNQNGPSVYVVTASDGCDSQPWQGTIYKINVAGTTPVLAASVPTVPSLASTGDAGGGIWGYGGLALDAVTGNLYVTAAADVNESTTPNGNRMIVYDQNLNLLGSYLPTDPPTFPCAGAPCDLDFGSTPTVFSPPGCPSMVVAGKKNGNLYLFKTPDLIASGQPTQILQINSVNDSLGNGGAADPSYWPTGNMVFEGTAGVGGNGFAGGIVALKVTNACTMTGAWSHALGGQGQPNSTVTIANGVAFIGVGQSGQVVAFNATDGTQLWQSASALGHTFAAPMVARGSVFVGSWDGFNSTDNGTVRAYSLSGGTLPSTLSVSPLSLTFTATAGGSNPPNQTITVSNSGTGILSYTASSDAAWLSATPASGTAPQDLIVSVNTSGLSAGTLTAHITISAAGALQSPQTVTVTLNLSSSGGGGGPVILMGDQVIESQVDFNSAGVAEAFQSTATAAGTSHTITFYLDSSSTASQVTLGIYSDAAGHPGTLMTQASLSQLTAGAWNTLTVPAVALAQGSNYWIAILGVTGTVRFHDRSHGCSSETNASRNLTALPATWSPGTAYTDCPISAYVSQ